MLRKFLFVSCALGASLVTTTAFAQGTDDDDHGLKLAPSVERLAGLSHATLKPEGDTTGSGTVFSVAGVIHNPLSMPRAAFDVYLPGGFGFGAALGYGSITTSETSNGTTRDEGTLRAWLFSPRIEYRVSLGPYFDLIPRLGVTFLGGSETRADGRSCSGTTLNCTTIPGDTDSVSAIAISPEAVGVLRLTTSFNLLGGLSWDQLISASSSHSSGYSGQSSSNDAKGSYSNVHLWFGMGGYL